MITHVRSFMCILEFERNQVTNDLVSRSAKGQAAAILEAILVTFIGQNAYLILDERLIKSMHI